MPFAEKAARLEALEETGIIVKNIEYFSTAQAGATMIWDLLYFVVDDFDYSPEGKELGEGENITTEWKSFDEVENLIKENKMTEDRSIGVLYKYFLQGRK